MKNSKIISCTLILILTTVLHAKFLNYTGEVLPRPQQVAGDWQFVDIDTNNVNIIIDANAHNAIKLAKTMLLSRVEETAKQVAGNSIFIWVCRIPVS